MARDRFRKGHKTQFGPMQCKENFEKRILGNFLLFLRENLKLVLSFWLLVDILGTLLTSD